MSILTNAAAVGRHTTLPPESKERHRLPELDALRGLAVLLMVLYHTAFDLDYFWGWPVLQSLGVGGWLLARTSAILFLLIAGICATISWERKTPQSTEPSGSSQARCSAEWGGASRSPTRFGFVGQARATPFRRSQRESDGKWQGYWQILHCWRKVLRRFAILASAAAIISFTTWLIAPQDFVKFGILHLFAFATPLLPLFHPLKQWNMPIGLFIISIPTLPTILTLPSVPTTLAVILGFPPTYFSSLDYFPLIPWFGVILIGTAIGHILYIQHPNWRNPSSIFNSPAFATSLRQGYGRQEATAGKQFFILNFAGRHSLLIYLLHQPILLALLFLLLKPPSSY